MDGVIYLALSVAAVLFLLTVAGGATMAIVAYFLKIRSDWEHDRESRKNGWR